MTDSKPPKVKSPALTWTYVAVLVSALIAAGVLGSLQVLGEDNTARIIVGVLVLLGLEARGSKPPIGPTSVIGVLAASEFAGAMLQGSF